jgi:hypothetical protein
MVPVDDERSCRVLFRFSFQERSKRGVKLFRANLADRRRSTYLTGIVLAGIGLGLFLSVFVTLGAHLGDWNSLRARRSSMVFRAASGLIVAGVGFGAMAWASHAAAVAEHRDGEPVEILRRSERDRELLRRDGEDDAAIEDPRRWPSRLSTRTGASEASQGRAVEAAEPHSRKPRANVVVKIRCRTCRNLSVEDANHCEHCGRRL